MFDCLYPDLEYIQFCAINLAEHGQYDGFGVSMQITEHNNNLSTADEPMLLNDP